MHVSFLGIFVGLGLALAGAGAREVPGTSPRTMPASYGRQFGDAEGFPTAHAGAAAPSWLPGKATGPTSPTFPAFVGNGRSFVKAGSRNRRTCNSRGGEGGSGGRGGGACMVATGVTPPYSKKSQDGGERRNARLAKVFREGAEAKRAAFIPYLTAGYPKKTDTVDLLLALQEGGADVIELGVPFSDPQADGPTIQAANQVALKNKVTVRDCLHYVRCARARGLTAPVVLMGYINPFLAYGLDRLVEDAELNGADGFLVVDLLPDEGHDFIAKCHHHRLSVIPLVTPSTTEDRIRHVASTADSFVYCVSVNGVTGARDHLPADLKDFVARARSATDKPLSVGFGISSAEQVGQVAAIADGVVVGSAFMKAIDEVPAEAPASEIAAHLLAFTAGLRVGINGSKRSGERRWRRGGVAYGGGSWGGRRGVSHAESGEKQGGGAKRDSASTRRGYFGEFGGRYIPEILVGALRGLEAAYDAALTDPAFHEEVAWYRRHYIGGPTPLHFANLLSAEVGGAQIWLKREELAHTGSHAVNNAVGQALLAKRIGKSRVVTETAAGQHGVATASMCARLGLECTIYVGAVDCERQKLSVQKMKLLGAKVVPVENGSGKLKDAANEALRDCVTNLDDTYYLPASTAAPHPFPTIVRGFNSIVGQEARSQIIERAGRLPDHVVACVGRGANAIGIFQPFFGDVEKGRVNLVGVEAGGKGSGALNSAATLAHGSPGVLYGTRTYLLQDPEGQISDTHSIAAGLDFPAVGPDHSWLKDSGLAEYVAVDDAKAMGALQLLARTEGILSALEPAHAIYHATQMAKRLPADEIILVNVCGRGDKDMQSVADFFEEDV